MNGRPSSSNSTVNTSPTFGLITAASAARLGLECMLMYRISRCLAAVTVATVTAVGLSGCGSDGGTASGDDATSATGEIMTTTSSTAVPGPADSETTVPARVAERWTELGGVAGDLGTVTEPPIEVAGGSITKFERGSIVLTPQGRAFVVQGEILTAYLNESGPAGDLGFPTADESTTDGGWISTFEGGVITYIDGVVEVEYVA